MKINVKSILKTIAAASLLALVSCSDLDIQKDDNAGSYVKNSASAQTAFLKISLDSSFRTIDPDIKLSDLTDFELTGSWVNENEHTENESVYTWENYSAFVNDCYIPVKNGSWTFKLTAKKGRTVYSSALETAEINLYSNNSIYFYLKRSSEPENGSGTLNLSVSWYNSDEDFRNPKKAVITVKKDNAAESVVSTDTVTELTNPLVINKSLAKGSYILNVDFYAKDGERDLYLTTWSELVNIATDHTSSAERDIAMDGICRIDWNLRDGDESVWKEGTVIPLTFSQKEGAALPSASDISREGYYFYGWVANYYYSTDYITEIAPGSNDMYLYGCWGKINPVPANDGIKVDMILPENTYAITLNRTDVETGDCYTVWQFSGEKAHPLSETTLSITDRFTEQGKTYYYDFYATYAENNSTYTYHTDSSQRKTAVAVNQTRVPHVVSVPDNITADIMNDTLVYNGTVSYADFEDLSGYSKKTKIIYSDVDNNYGTAGFDLTEKSFRKLITENNWKNVNAEPYSIQLYYASDDGHYFWYLPEEKGFNSKFPTFRISATQDHTILSVENTDRGHKLSVFVPAGTKKVDLGFCTIGDGTSALTLTDKVITVLNKYENPSNGSSKIYSAVYTDASSKENSASSTNWISLRNADNCAQKPVLTSYICAHFDEVSNCIVLDEKPQVNFGEQEPYEWAIELSYYFGDNSEYTAYAEYTGGNEISVPLAVTPDADTFHSIFNHDNGQYDFYERHVCIKIPAEQNDSTESCVNYTVAFGNSYFEPDDFVMHKKHTVTFNPDNGSAVTTQKVNRMDYAQEPETEPVKQNYLFGGWALEGEQGRFDFENTQITDDITLKAIWLTDAVPVYSVDITIVQNEMPMEYTVDEENGEIHFSFPYYATICVNGERVTDTWYNWTFEYKDLPKGYYTIDIVERNDWGVVPGDRSSTYSYTMHVQVL